MGRFDEHTKYFNVGDDNDTSVEYMMTLFLKFVITTSGVGSTSGKAPLWETLYTKLVIGKETTFQQTHVKEICFECVFKLAIFVFMLCG